MASYPAEAVVPEGAVEGVVALEVERPGDVFDLVGVIALEVVHGRRDVLRLHPEGARGRLEALASRRDARRVHGAVAFVGHEDLLGEAHVNPALLVGDALGARLG